MSGTADISYFQADQSDRLFSERLNGASDKQLAAILCRVASHLHDVVRETRPTVQDWRAAIAFLTEIGHLCDDRRQEWVLVSDLLGTSSLVDALNSDRPSKATPNTMRGPFYRPDAPFLKQGDSISLDGAGEAVSVSIAIRDLNGRPVANAQLETWQANSEGYYENQQPDLIPENNLRGRFSADMQGNVTYRTIRPAGYEVPSDGPLGELLVKLGVPLRRPAHIYFQVSAPGFETLTTQIFDAADPSLGADPLFSVKPGLVRSFRPSDDGQGLDLNIELFLNPIAEGGRQ